MAKRKAPGRSKRTNEEAEDARWWRGSESGLDGATTRSESTRARRKQAVEAAKASRATSESRVFSEERNRWNDIQDRLRQGIEDIEEVRPALVRLRAYCEDVLRERYPTLPTDAMEWAAEVRRRLKAWENAFLQPDGPAPLHIQVKLLRGQPVQWQGDSSDRPPRSRMDLRLQYLNKKLNEKGVALPMPRSRGGKPGIKAEIKREALEERPDLFTTDSFDSAWKLLPKKVE